VQLLAYARPAHQNLTQKLSEANSLDLPRLVFGAKVVHFLLVMENNQPPASDNTDTGVVSTLNQATTAPSIPITNNDNAGTATVASKRGPGFTLVENLIICKAFIAASEDPIAGRAQKGKVFKHKMFVHYQLMIDNQATYDKTMLQQASAATKQAYAGSLLAAGSYPARKEESIFDRFVRKISPEVCKYLGVCDTTDIESGQTEDDHQKNCLEIFQQRYGRTFEFEECYNYLKDKTKFLLYRNKEDEKKKEDRPLGNKAAKKAAQDAALIKLALDGMKESPPSDVSIMSNNESTKKEEDIFYHNATAFLNKTGDALGEYMSHQKAILEQQNEKEMLTLLATPEKKLVLQEKTRLYLAQMRVKRLKLEKNLKALDDTTEDSSTTD
jgi:hypothetical protein